MRKWLRSLEQPHRRALFKAPDPKRRDVHPNELYSNAMERVAYRFADLLGLPVPEVWLERVEGDHGSLARQIDNARDLPNVGKAILMIGDIVNRDVLPLAVAFDLWVGNADRKPANIMLEPLPTGTRAERATQSRLWMIDNGFAGLFPPAKVAAPTPTSPPETANFGPRGEMVTEWERLARSVMPPVYKDPWFRAAEDVRQGAVDRIRQLEDDTIDAVLGEVPSPYLTGQQAELTGRFFKLRRDRLDEIVRIHW